MLASELEKNSDSFSPPGLPVRSPTDAHRAGRSPPATVCVLFVAQ